LALGSAPDGKHSLLSMADVDDKKGSPPQADLSATGASASGAIEGEGEDDAAVGELGSDKYVFAAFFAAGVGIAYLSGKMLAALWNTLAEWPAVVRNVPWLLRYAEDERPTFTMAAGVIIALVVVATNVRKDGLRRWADDVASELSKVHWPKKDTVTNGTVVVIAAGLFATIYIGLLDRLWGFLTMLVYGA
jgi:preprotein translocase subunit SecE